MSRRTPALAVAALLLSVSLTACGSSPQPSDGDGPLRVGATPVPHAEILQFVKDDLAEEAGLDLAIVEFTDYVQPNVALSDGAIDANYFQHVPYLEEQVAGAGYDFTVVVPVHLEPLGIYSSRLTDLADLPDGGTVAIPNDPSNGGRALILLADNDLITLADTGDASPTVSDITDNPHNLNVVEIEAAQLPRSLADTAISVINGNYAIEANLNPLEDALALESAEDNPYANVLVVRTGEEDDPRVTTLAELLASPEVAAFIEETYQGAVIPAS